MQKYETHEVPLSELIKRYIADLPVPTGWSILAIDLIADVLVLKREAPQEAEKEGGPEATQTTKTIDSQLEKQATS